MLVRSIVRCIWTGHGPVRLCQVDHPDFAGGDWKVSQVPGRNPVIACPGLATPAAPNNLALTVVRILPSAIPRASASATMIDFGAESSRPAISLSTLQPPPVTRREARLASGLPATTLTGLDLHQLVPLREVSSAHLESPSPKLSLARRYPVLRVGRALCH